MTAFEDCVTEEVLEGRPADEGGFSRSGARRKGGDGAERAAHIVIMTIVAASPSRKARLFCQSLTGHQHPHPNIRLHPQSDQSSSFKVAPSVRHQNAQPIPQARSARRIVSPSRKRFACRD
jgi:hypothetical protein